MKVNISIIMLLEMAGCHKKSKNALFSLWSLKLEKKIRFNYLAIKKMINLYEVNT